MVSARKLLHASPIFLHSPLALTSFLPPFYSSLSLPIPPSPIYPPLFLAHAFVIDIRLPTFPLRRISRPTACPYHCSGVYTYETPPLHSLRCDSSSVTLYLVQALTPAAAHSPSPLTRHQLACAFFYVRGTCLQLPLDDSSLIPHTPPIYSDLQFPVSFLDPLAWFPFPPTAS